MEASWAVLPRKKQQENVLNKLFTMATKKRSGVKKLGIAAALAGAAAGAAYLLSGKRGAKNRAKVKKIAKKAGSLARKGASKLKSAGKKGLSAAKRAIKRQK